MHQQFLIFFKWGPLPRESSVPPCGPPSLWAPQGWQTHQGASPHGHSQSQESCTYQTGYCRNKC